MRVISVNVGMPHPVEAAGKSVTTGIFKKPAAGRLLLRRLNFDGDGQADLQVHGGPDRAAYLYPSEHYAFWKNELDRELAWGSFGENVDLEGVLEDDAHIGDEIRMGETRIRITSPRLPCFKLGIRLERKDILKRFVASERTGFYVAVIEEGRVGAGDDIEIVHRDPQAVSIRDIVRLYQDPTRDLALLQRAGALEWLETGWREHFRKLAANRAG